MPANGMRPASFRARSMPRRPKSACLGSAFPEEYGGVPADQFMKIVASQELARAGAGGVSASLMSHTIGSPPIARAARPEVKARVLPQILSGQKISALAITEPSGGSDVANLRTKARRDGDHYVVSGEKTFITSGMRADYLTVAVRTGGEGAGGVSLLLIPGDTPGLSRTKLKKMGWWASDTATLHFDECRVPAENLIGEEGHGLQDHHAEFQQRADWHGVELHGLCAGLPRGSHRLCQRAQDLWQADRAAPGDPPQDRRHGAAGRGLQAMLELLAWRLGQGENPVAEICMMKNQATQTMAFCASEAVQIFGGAGFMRGIKVERIYREVKVNAIGGGTEEIMKDLASAADGVVTT